MRPEAIDSDFRRLIDRLAAGDAAVLDGCLKAAGTRLTVLARRMLRDYPTVRRWADSDDVVQNTLIRLNRVLAEWRPGSSEDFFQMAATQMRRALLDLARFHARRERAGLRAAGEPPPEMAEEADSSSEIDRWCAFHEAVERLPDEQREIVSLRYYHGWQVRQIAETLEICERTVIRRWQAALWKLAGDCGVAE